MKKNEKIKSIKNFLRKKNLLKTDYLKHWFHFRRNRKTQGGQGLIEYLILVALMSVATIGILRTLNQTIKTRFANAIYALQGRNQKARTHNLRKEEYQRSDLSNFMSGAASSDNKKTDRTRKY